MADLTPGQARDARAALETLQGFYERTGRRVSLLAGISDYCEAATKLGGRSLAGAVEGFLSTVATVKRKDLSAAVEEFIAGRKSKTEAKDGKRPQLSPGYHYTVSMWLREFAKTFPGHAVCDLSKQLLDTYMARHGAVSPKTRNERRSAVRMFLKWCVKKDFLLATHRLLEADGMAKEIAQPEEIEFYTAGELRAMLERASKRQGPLKEGQEPEADYTSLLPLIALVGLGGVRLQEAARLTWKDVFRVPGYVEISSAKSRTRSRRLVTICLVLAQWLEPYRGRSGAIWTQCLDKFHTGFNSMLAALGIPAKRNGLRHGFVSCHYALYADEGPTAKEAGNSPAVIHSAYKGLATRKESEQWFAVAPKQPASVVQSSSAKLATL